MGRQCVVCPLWPIPVTAGWTKHKHEVFFVEIKYEIFAIFSAAAHAYRSLCGDDECVCCMCEPNATKITHKFFSSVHSFLFFSFLLFLCVEMLCWPFAYVCTRSLSTNQRYVNKREQQKIFTVRRHTKESIYLLLFHLFFYFIWFVATTQCSSCSTRTHLNCHFWIMNQT